MPIAKPLLNVSKALSTNPYEHTHHTSVGNEMMLSQTQKVSKVIQNQNGVPQMMMSSFDEGNGKYSYNSSTPTATIQLDQRTQTKTSRNQGISSN